MRPTFKHNGCEVRAAGILVESDGYRLLRRVRGRYEDVGGKTDAVDKCALDTAVREAVEETDGKLLDPRHTRAQCAKKLKDLLEDSIEHICDKYMISGELAWLVAQTLAESKLYDMKEGV